ncbi:MAG TPA: 3-isopropylmalate dehydratase small subunit [Patescibacteria group bacterium]|nr:3-isopropylmalate dehydratase small subunit [Patescibacteria group bacterium]
MKPFANLSSHMVPLPFNDVDTDQIIPARYLKVTNKEGLAEGCFAGWRYASNGDLQPEFALNRPACFGAQVLLAGDNFGTGSSREHAAWALLSWGFKAVLSTSFADIFQNNAYKNGLLPVTVDQQTHQQLFSLVEEEPETRITIDLENQHLILPDGRQIDFNIDPFNKTCLLEGMDQLGFLLKHEPDISAYEQRMEGAA